MSRAQSCQALCDPTDCSLPGSSVHGILQTRILGWAVIPFSRGSSLPRDASWSPALQADPSPILPCLSHQGSHAGGLYVVVNRSCLPSPVSVQDFCPIGEMSSDQKSTPADFTGGPVVESLPVNAGDNAWSGKIPCATGQPSSCITTPEPKLKEPVLCNERSPHAPTREGSCSITKTQHRQAKKRKSVFWW